MSNTLGTISAAIVAQEALTKLEAQFPLLTKVTSNFGADNIGYGSTINTRILSDVTAQDYDATNGYVPYAATGSNVSVTINKHKHATVAFNDQENSVGVDWVGNFSDAIADGLGNAMVDDLFALVTTSNFSNATTVTSVAFDRTSIIKANGALSTRKIAKANRYAVVNPTYYAALAEDSSLANQAFYAKSNLAETGIVPFVGGCEIIESSVPTNSQGLVGLVYHPSALVIATRVPSVPETSLGEVTVVSSPKLGVSVQVRKFYDIAKGQTVISANIMYGVAVGNPLALQRFKE